MAIAYYVPREYGPPPPQPQNNPEIIDIHNHHFNQDANNNNVQAPRPTPSTDNHNNLVSLFSGFVNEMIGVFRNSGVEQVREAPQQRNQQEPVRIRMRRPAARDLPDLRIDQGNGQDNNQNLPDLIPSPLISLPDIVTCHAGISFHYNSTSNQPDSSRDGPPVSPLSPTSSNHQPSTTMDFEVSVKWGVGLQQETPVQLPAQQEQQLTPQETFRLAGAQLRMIADSFQNERSHGRITRPTQSTFELKIVITVAVPTVALVALGLAYLRRS